MNKVILMGRLTRDPEMRQTPTGTSVVSFSIAVNRRFAKEGTQQADFINCVAWRQQAEFICKYFNKGSMIALVGSIQTRTWDDKDGKRQYSTEVLVDEVYFTGSRAESGTHRSDDGFSQIPQPRPQASNDDFEGLGFSPIDTSEDDLPF